MHLNPKLTINSWVLNFVRYFYDDKLMYTEHLAKKWIKSLIPLIIDIVLAGFVFYLFLSGIVFVFPKTSPYIFVGTTYWHIPIIIIYLGLIIWFFENRYEYLRRGYKNVK